MIDPLGHYVIVGTPAHLHFVRRPERMEFEPERVAPSADLKLATDRGSPARVGRRTSCPTLVPPLGLVALWHQEWCLNLATGRSQHGLTAPRAAMRATSGVAVIDSAHLPRENAYRT